MKFINKLENKLGRFAIPNLYFYIIGCIILGYVLYIFTPSVYSYLTLNPYMIFAKHQYWRFFTWIFTVPYSITSFIDVLLVPINLYFYYIIGKSLEFYWGRFMYNLYVFGGMLLINILVLVGGLLYFEHTYDYMLGEVYDQLDQSAGYMGIYCDVTKYMLISIFLAFAVIGSDNYVLFFFLIPMKMKYLAYLDLCILAYYFYIGGFFGRLCIIGAVTNYFIYFMINRNRTHATISDKMRRRKFVKAKQRGYKKAQYNEDGTVMFPGAARRVTNTDSGNSKGASIHKCAVCGRTELDDPTLEFRYCSKCNGTYEYCTDHLYTHEHIK